MSQSNSNYNSRLPARQKAKDKVRTVIQKMKQDQIQSQNNVLQEKTNQINSKQSGPSLQERSNQPFWNPFIRQNPYLRNKKMLIKQLVNHYERGGVVISQAKMRGLSMGQRAKSFNLVQRKTFKFKQQQSNQTIRKRKIYSSNSQKRVELLAPSFSERQFVQLSSKKEKIIFNEPQKNQKRQVLYKKTIILSTNQSCLIELSLLQDRMLIVAYLMGIQNKCIKEILSSKRTDEIMKEYCNKLDQFCSRISIQQISNQYQVIKVPVSNSSYIAKEVISNEDQTRQKIRVQRQFLKRNYYNLHSYQRDKSLSNKDKSTISNKKAEEIVHRLVGHKKYFIKTKQKYSKVECGLTSNQKNQPSVHFKVNINIQQNKFAIPKSPLESTFPSQLKQDTTKRVPPQRYEEKKIKISLKKTDSMDFQHQSEENARKSQIKNSMQESKAKTIKVVHSNKVQENNQHQQGNAEDSQELLEFQNPSALLESIKNKSQIDQELLNAIIQKVHPLQNSKLEIKVDLNKQQIVDVI